MQVTVWAYQCLGLLDVFMLEEELPVEIAQIYRVEVDYVYLAEACQAEVLKKFAADAANSDQKNACL
jgi:hypothetical protein